MRYFAWLLKPPGWVIAVGALAGAGLFIVATILASPFLTRDTPPRSDLLLRLLIVVALTLVLPATRAFGAGFFAAMLIASFGGVFDLDLWWAPVRQVARDVTRAARERKARDENTNKWLTQHRARPLDVDAALLLLSNLGGCLTPLTTDQHDLGIPDNLDALLIYPGCEAYRTQTLRGHAEYPVRYLDGDTGWRWDFDRIATPTAAGGPNFRVTLRPDSILGHAGPVVLADGDGRVRVRDRADAPWHMVATPVPTLRRVRECVLLAASMAVDARDTTAMFAYLPDGFYARRGCPEIRITSSTSRENGDRVLDINAHVKRDATVSDPAPTPCEEDTAVACAEAS